MKNIHLSPTDKPSRLYKQVNKLKLRFIADSPIDSDISINQHIYITCDEEIKEGDWFFDSIKGVNYGIYKHVKGFINKTSKKIILTTDPQLIADGVQAIDDEFLEWFVKNLTCEKVEVEKLDTFKKTNEVYVDEIAGGNYYEIIKNYKITIPQEEPKKETVEEAAENMWLDPIKNLTSKMSFIEGAKWQQEQDKKMYSEEEVLEILEHHTSYLQTFISQYVDRNDMEENEEWFEQFKKK